MAEQRRGDAGEFAHLHTPQVAAAEVVRFETHASGLRFAYRPGVEHDALGAFGRNGGQGVFSASVWPLFTAPELRAIAAEQDRLEGQG